MPAVAPLSRIAGVWPALWFFVLGLGAGVGVAVGDDGGVGAEFRGASATSPDREAGGFGDPDGGPSVVATEPAVVPPPTHTVESGDTFGTIAARYGTTASQLRRVNALAPGTVLQPGDTLMLPAPAAMNPDGITEARTGDWPAGEVLAAAAREAGLAPALVKAVAWQETRWRHRRVSDRGAIGIMQVRPRTGEVMAEHLDRTLDLTELEDNAVAGATYLAVLLERANGDLDRALAAYYQGPTSLAENGPFPDTEAYVESVRRNRAAFAGAQRTKQDPR